MFITCGYVLVFNKVNMYEGTCIYTGNTTLCISSQKRHFGNAKTFH